MTENLDSLNTAISLLVRAVLLAARSSGRVRKRSVKCSAPHPGSHPQPSQRAFLCRILPLQTGPMAA
jgi:hypothetical protein